MNRIALSVIVLLQALISCNFQTVKENNPISTDTTVIEKGKMLFNQNCASCHEFKNDGIGPSLSGVTEETSFDWLVNFIKNPQQIISSGDKRADSLFKKYKSVMPSFAALKNDELSAIIAYLNIHKASADAKAKEDKKGIIDPIPEKIKTSGLVVNIVPVTKFPSSNIDGKPPVTRITKMSFEPGSGNIFINDLRGKLYKLKNGNAAVYLDMKKLKPDFITEPGLATGFGSFAFHPDFSKNGLLYTTHTEAPKSGKPDFKYDDSIKVELQWVLTEWKIPNHSSDTINGTNRELLRIDMVASSHGVQEITFNPLAKPGAKDYGLLYIGVGDGGSVQLGYSFIANSRDKIWGSVLRIDPQGKNSANGRYGIPHGNPFNKKSKERSVEEVYAYGFRNPHRITWTKSGDMLVSNVGQANIESINLIKPGNNYGWPLREGRFVFDPYGNFNNIFPLPSNDSIYKITYPIVQFDHDEGLAVSGGYEYLGRDLNALNGRFLFGDIPSGRLFYFDIADIKKGKPVTIKEWKITINGIPKSLKEVCGSDRVDLHFGRDANGELYILTKADGMLYRITDAKMIQ